MWHLIPKVSIPKINMQVWLSYMKKATITIQMKRKYGGTEDRYSSEPQKAHLIGEFVIMAKFGGHALRHLASRLANMVRKGGRLKTLAIFFQIPY